jgi:hypothetical protein
MSDPTDALASRRNRQCGVWCAGYLLIAARAARHSATSRVMSLKGAKTLFHQAAIQSTR